MRASELVVVVSLAVFSAVAAAAAAKGEYKIAKKKVGAACKGLSALERERGAPATSGARGRLAISDCAPARPAAAEERAPFVLARGSRFAPEIICICIAAEPLARFFQTRSAQPGRGAQAGPSSSSLSISPSSIKARQTNRQRQRAGEPNSRELPLSLSLALCFSAD